MGVWGKPGGDSSAGCMSHGKGWSGESSHHGQQLVTVYHVLRDRENCPHFKTMKTEAQRGEMISLRSQASYVCPVSELGVFGGSAPARVGE